jgi:hypothetical protein
MGILYVHRESAWLATSESTWWGSLLFSLVKRFDIKQQVRDGLCG